MGREPFGRGFQRIMERERERERERTNGNREHIFTNIHWHRDQHIWKKIDQPSLKYSRKTY
jgi:hypothetical protein